MLWFKTHSLYVLLPAFILIGLFLMVHEVNVKHTFYKADGVLEGTVAHRPAEFPSIYNFNPLQGLTQGGPQKIYVAPPPISSDYWPCSQCHGPQGEENPQRRVLTLEHTNIKLHHGNNWCLNCHDYKNRDMLHLSDGTLIPFSQSEKLCGQCHGDIYRDWKLGIHGKRTGYWNGPKRYLLCVNCHWPHDPHFKPLKPLPPPVRPEFLGTAPLAPLPPSVEASPNAKSVNAEAPAAAANMPGGVPSPRPVPGESPSPASSGSPSASTSPAAATSPAAVASPAPSPQSSSQPTEAP